MVTARRGSGNGRSRGAPISVEVPDFAQFVRQLKAFAPHLEEELKELNYRVAQMVVPAAQARAATVGRQASKAAQALKSARAKASSSIVFNTARMPFGAGAEFGSMRHPQFKDWRGNGEDAGYFLYPTIREMTPQIVQEYAKGLDRISRQAGFN